MKIYPHHPAPIAVRAALGGLLAFLILASAGQLPAQTETAGTADEVNDLTFDNLKFEMEKGTDFSRDLLTEKILGYHGSTVRLRGYIRPNYKQTGLTKFIFVRDNKECCFGPQAAIYDNVLVRLAEGKQADFTVRPVTIEGRFALKEYTGPDGKVWSLYRMYDAEVQ